MDIWRMIGLRINLLSIGLPDLLAGISLFGYTLLYRKEVQRYFVDRYDILLVAICVGVAVLCGIGQFGTELSLNYVSVDSVTHYRMTLKVMWTQDVQGRLFLALLNNGLFVETFNPFVGSRNLYRVFVLADILSFLIFDFISSYF